MPAYTSRWMRHFNQVLLSLLACACTSLSAQEARQPQQLPVISLRAGMHIIKAQVAQTPQEQQTGLMWRKSMGSNEGMLFVFPQARQQCFWMKNTLLPLSIAFIADDGSIVNVDEMLPQTEKSHCSSAPVRYVLEMNKGWFKQHGMGAGQRLHGQPFSQ